MPSYVAKINLRRDGTDEIRREGHDLWVPLPTESDATAQPYVTVADTPITLIHVVRRADGKAYLIAGTKTTLYRFNGDLSDYFEDPLTGLASNDSDYGKTSGTHYAADYNGSPYFEEATRWEIIGSGFSANGKRWEAVDIADATVFNNGVDLPVAYRVEWRNVVPLYELREQGIVCVGTIKAFAGMLMCGDVTELKKNDVSRVLDAIRSGGVDVYQFGPKSSKPITATSSGTTVTASANFFASTDAGRTLEWWDGSRQVIQTVSTSTTTNIATMATSKTVSDAMTFRIVDNIGDTGKLSFSVVAESPFFTAAMVGQRIGWASGEVRRIMTLGSLESGKSRQVWVDQARTAANGELWVENPAAYLGKDALTAYFASNTPIAFDRRQYRILCGEIGDGQQFGVLVNGTFTTGSRIFQSDRCNRSLKVGDAISATGAGTDGGVLATTITGVGPGFIEMANAALSGGDGTIQRTSSIGSTAGIIDLQDSDGAILKAMELQDRLVVYTDSSIYVFMYTGRADEPWQRERIPVPHGRTLYYRNTLACIGGLAHVFAGRNQFLQFDFQTRMPTPIAAADLVGNLFFDYAKIADTDSIYSADNFNTQELWMVCPANTANPVLAYDYKYQTFSTVDYAPTAAESVKDPVRLLVGETPDWFLMGTSKGVILRYGLATESTGLSVADWDGKSIWYRRDSKPYSTTKAAYTSTLEDGLLHLGTPFDEKHVDAYVLQFSSQQPATVNTTPSVALSGIVPVCTVAFFGTPNPSKPVVALGTKAITDVNNHGAIGLHFINYYFKSRITSAIQAPLRIHQRTWSWQRISSGSGGKQ